jgi:8-oxo-dGTP diphosphatase
MLVVAGGILEENGMYLIAQRKRDDDFGLKWEFPGGKLDEGETGEECIVRELMEELGIKVEVTGFYDKFVEEDLTILYYLVRRVSGMFTLNDHEKVQWVFPDELGDYDLLSGDREIARKLAQRA